MKQIEFNKSIICYDDYNIDKNQNLNDFLNSDLLKELNIPYPEYGTAYNAEEAIEVANKVGYPVLVRPSYVIGGQRMRIVINDEEVEKAVISLLKHIPGNKILIDHFLDRCQEAEVDAIFDGEEFDDEDDSGF